MLLGLFRSNTNSDGSSENQDTCPNAPSLAKNGKELDQIAFSEYSRKSGLPALAQWPKETSMLVVASHRAEDVAYQLPYDTKIGASDTRAFPVNGSAVPFIGPIFEGKLVSRVRDVQTASHGEGKRMNNGDYFRNRSRQYQWSVQGRFKRRIRYDEIVTGQEFGRPFRNAPSSRMVKRGLDLLKHKLPETFECDLFSEAPRFEHPLLAGCQSFRIDRPEDIEGLPVSELHGIGEDGNVIENTALLEDDDIPQDGVARRKYFSKNCNLERYYYETEFIYTFDFFANFFSPARHRLELTPFFSIDLIPYFNGYPLFMSMAKEKTSGEYLWATEMWHKRLLNFDECPGRLARLFSGSESKFEEEIAKTECETVVEDD